jgi:large subunit ribosomal protein L34e
MPLPRHRSNSVRKIKYKSPSGESRVRYRRRKKGNTHSCALTGEKLTGVNSKQGVSKSSRRPNRPFGGRLSPAATRKVIKLRARLEGKEITLEQVPVEFLPYMKKE